MQIKFIKIIVFFISSLTSLRAMEQQLPSSFKFKTYDGKKTIIPKLFIDDSPVLQTLIELTPVESLQKSILLNCNINGEDLSKAIKLYIHYHKSHSLFASMDELDIINQEEIQRLHFIFQKLKVGNFFSLTQRHKYIRIECSDDIIYTTKNKIKGKRFEFLDSYKIYNKSNKCIGLNLSKKVTKKIYTSLFYYLNILNQGASLPINYDDWMNVLEALEIFNLIESYSKKICNHIMKNTTVEILPYLIELFRYKGHNLQIVMHFKNFITKNFPPFIIDKIMHVFSSFEKNELSSLPALLKFWLTYAAVGNIKNKNDLSAFINSQYYPLSSHSSFEYEVKNSLIKCIMYNQNLANLISFACQIDETYISSKLICASRTIRELIFDSLSTCVFERIVLGREITYSELKKIESLLKIVDDCRTCSSKGVFYKALDGFNESHLQRLAEIANYLDLADLKQMIFDRLNIAKIICSGSILYISKNLADKLPILFKYCQSFEQVETFDELSSIVVEGDFTSDQLLNALKLLALNKDDESKLLRESGKNYLKKLIENLIFLDKYGNDEKTRLIMDYIFIYCDIESVDKCFDSFQQILELLPDSLYSKIVDHFFENFVFWQRVLFGSSFLQHLKQNLPNLTYPLGCNDLQIRSEQLKCFLLIVAVVNQRNLKDKFSLIMHSKVYQTLTTPELKKFFDEFLDGLKVRESIQLTPDISSFTKISKIEKKRSYLQKNQTFIKPFTSFLCGLGGGIIRGIYSKSSNGMFQLPSLAKIGSDNLVLIAGNSFTNSLLYKNSSFFSKKECAYAAFNVLGYFAGIYGVNYISSGK